MGICKSNIQNEIEDFDRFYKNHIADAEPLQIMNTIKIKRLKVIKHNTYNHERTIYEIYLNEYNETLLKRVSSR